MNSKEKGFSLVELIIVVLIIGVISAIAVPNLMSSRRAANEASAISVARKLSSSQLTYYSTSGNQNYGTAAQLYVAQLINKRTAAAANVNVGGNPARNTPSDGYNFRVQVTAGSSSTGRASTFVFSANPSSTSGVTQTGTHRFCIREDGLLRSSFANLGTKYNYAQCGFANGHSS